MALATPESWSGLNRSSIDLGDILGTPGIDATAVAASAGAFADAVEPIGPDTALLLLSRRNLVGTSGQLSRPERAQETAVAVCGSAVRPVHVLRSATGSHHVFQQQVRGHDVVGCRLLVHADSAGSYGVSGHPLGDLERRDPGPPPNLRREAVERRAHELVSVEPGSNLEIRAVVVPHDARAEWAWFVRVPVEAPYADVHVFLSAVTLEPLLMYPASVGSFLGEATAYRGSPARCPDPVRVCLRDLGDDPAGGLRGPRIEVTTGIGDAAIRPDRNFDFTEDDAEFDEASAFHNASEALRFFGGLFAQDLFENELFRPLRLHVHDQNDPANAHFHPDRKLITLGDWPAGPTAARSADVVFHEIAHAVTHAVCRLFVGPSHQARGIGEGYADYFASSALDDPRFGDYVTGKPQGHRSCARDGVRIDGNPDDVDPYILGEAWANVLWALRSELGAPVADAIAAESLYFAQTLATIPEALTAMQMADAELFPRDDSVRGRHADLIDREFAERFA